MIIALLWSFHSFFFVTVLSLVIFFFQVKIKRKTFLSVPQTVLVNNNPFFVTKGLKYTRHFFFHRGLYGYFTMLETRTNYFFIYPLFIQFFCAVYPFFLFFSVMHFAITVLIELSFALLNAFLVFMYFITVLSKFIHFIFYIHY